MVARKSSIFAATMIRHGFTEAGGGRGRVGRIHHIAEALDVSPTAVRFWWQGQRKPSVETTLMIEAKLGVPRHEIRPDIWPPPRTVPSNDDPPRRRRRSTAQQAAAAA